MMGTNGRYILRDGVVEPCEDLMEWARFMEKDMRRVAMNEVQGPPVQVSTVFLGLDHNFGGGGPPLLFETMVFGGKLDHSQERYSTLEEAKAGHEKWVARVRMGEEG